MTLSAISRRARECRFNQSHTVLILVDRVVPNQVHWAVAV